jgi:hypothetical protein
MSKLKFYNHKHIEERAEARLREYQQKLGILTQPPVPIDDLIEHIFDLKISWEKIEAKPEETILGALRPRTRQIVLNEDQLTLFNQKPGIERSTKGHELGHWDLFIDHATLNHPSLPGLSVSDSFALRSSSNGDVEIIKLLATDNELYAAYKKMQEGKDPPLVKSAVDYYASVLSMPRFLLIPVIKSIRDDWTNWSEKPFNYQLKDLYNISKLFDVTISALQVRLEQLNLLYISEDKIIYRNKAESKGQTSLF